LKNESSTAVAFRALVMLGCMISIPIAALWGGGLPELAKQLLQQHLGLQTASAAASLSEAPRFVPGTPSGVVGDPALAAASAMPLQPPVVQFAPQVAPPQGVPASAPPSRPVMAPPTAVVSAAYEARVEGNAAMPPAQNPAFVPGAQTETSVYQHKPGLVPVSFEEGVPPPQAAAPQAAGNSTGEQFQVIQGRLRQLGASYYLLESWGVQGELFRFYCKMAIGGNPNYTRYFEAVDTDPVRVMAKVLQDVEAWRAGRM